MNPNVERKSEMRIIPQCDAAAAYLWGHAEELGLRLVQQADEFGSWFYWVATN